MLRDIDYAAKAVQRAIVDKFGRTSELQDLQVTAQERTIVLRHGERTAEGTRDSLLATIRKAGSYEDLWQSCPGEAGSPQ
jgi:hypothetical protein